MNDPVEFRRQDRDEITDAMLQSPDKKERALFWRRPDGQVEFEYQRLQDREEQGQHYSIWLPTHPPSGLYDDLLTAQSDARRVYPSLSYSNETDQ